MNYPPSQRTGRIGELSVELLFTTWGWTVGHDHVDVGYDHFVEPDQSKFAGARFLVQTKGTARAKKGRIVAQVSKSRLRQYATNPLPVFIVRALPDSGLYWVHAQTWCRQNESKLSGSGYAGIVFNYDRSLNERDEFEEYLCQVLAPAETRTASAARLVAKRMDFLSSIDPRLKVDLTAGPAGETYSVSATSENDPPVGHLRMTLAGNEEAKNLAKMKLADHLAFGTPADLNVDALELSGSPLFKEIGVDRMASGSVNLQTRPRKGPRISFVAGKAFRITSEMLETSTLMHEGNKGIAVVPEARALVSVTAKFERLPTDFFRAFYTVNVDHEVLSSKRLAELTELADLCRWSQAMTRATEAIVVIDGLGGRITSNVPNVEELRPLLTWLEILGHAQAVAKFVNSDVILDADLQITENERNALSLAYRALRGERVSLSISRVGVETGNTNIPDNLLVAITTTIIAKIGGKLIGTVPVKIGLNNFTQIWEEERLVAFEPSEHAEAWMMFYEGVEDDIGSVFLRPEVHRAD